MLRVFASSGPKNWTWAVIWVRSEHKGACVSVPVARRMEALHADPNLQL